MENTENYIGAIKICYDIEEYKKYGDTRFIAECQVGHSICGREEIYTKVICEKAIFQKISEDKYLLLGSLTKINNFTPTILYTQPTEFENIFIEKTSLEPYSGSYIEFYKYKKKKNLKVKIKEKIRTKLK